MEPRAPDLSRRAFLGARAFAVLAACSDDGGGGEAPDSNAGTDAPPAPASTMVPSDTVLALAGEAGYPIVLGFDVDPLDCQDPVSTRSPRARSTR